MDCIFHQYNKQYFMYTSYVDLRILLYIILLNSIGLTVLGDKDNKTSLCSILRNLLHYPPDLFS